MQSDDLADAPLQDYPERSVWTTWAISYQAIRERHEHTANLLLLWSFLDNKDLWHGLFAAACSRSGVAAKMLSGWVGDTASSEVKFSRAMQLLCNYSLVEQIQETTSYATHPVVHQWAHHSQGKRFATELSRLTIVAVGWAVPASSTRDYAALQRRLLLHAQACSRQVVERNAVWDREAENGGDGDVDEDQERKTVLDAVHLLGLLYADQGRLGEAEKMYERALRGKEEALGVGHSSTLDTVNNLGLLYAAQGKLDEAEQMYERALRGFEEALGVGHSSTLDTVNNLGLLYADQGVQQYLPALTTLQNMGDLYATRAESAKAREVYTRALSGLTSVLGPSSERCMGLSAKIDALPSASREGGGQLKLPTEEERPAPQHDRAKKGPKLSIRRFVRKMF
jgi:tetratricopeptide (TPR) repeat protein